MTLAMGIDTGGTFTDCVIFDLSTQQVVSKAKSVTTYEDLTVGILKSIEELNFNNFRDIKLVSLSTTMATNAVVASQGCEVGLILIGGKPDNPIPVQHQTVVRGGHDLKGNPREDLDFKEIEQALEGFLGKVEALAISGFASVRNPEHELKIKALAEHYMDLPVVCGHQLTTSLGFHERTVTAVLNARLIPIITGLINSVKQVLSEKKITAPLMVVKGDGTLMSAAKALKKPIETVLSGPAASVIGATALIKASQGLVLDMGGTTTDIAIIKDGVPRINPEGATVGGWLTRVEAAEIFTYGLGGDSYIRLHKNGQLVLGPQKVWPLAFVGFQHPHLLDELELQRKNRFRLKPSETADVFTRLIRSPSITLTETEQKVLEILDSGPHSLLYIAELLGKQPFSLDLDRLVKLGVLAKAAVTPTDLLHVKEIYNQWDKKIAAAGIGILAETMGISTNDFIEYALNILTENLCLAILQSTLAFEGTREASERDLRSNSLLNKLLSPKDTAILNISPSLKIPIIGIGAPTAAYLPKVAEKLNAELLIPQDSDVANAVGAVTGKILEKIAITIKPFEDGYFLYSQWERKKFSNLDEAKKYALELGEKQAILIAENTKTWDYQILKSCHDHCANGGTGIHLETIAEIKIIGRPNW